MEDPLMVDLRPLVAADVDSFLTWAGDPEVTESLFWDAHSNRQTAEDFLKSVAENHPWFMAIVVNEKPVGAITLDKGKDRGERRAELGYVLAKASWGQGIATAAVRIALERGFQDLDVDRIEAYVDPENLGSIAVLEKAGIIKEGHLKKYVVHRGRLRDRFLYALTK